MGIGPIGISRKNNKEILTMKKDKEFRKQHKKARQLVQLLAQQARKYREKERIQKASVED